MDIKSDIIRIARRDPLITKFKYYKNFFNKWENFFEKVDTSKTVYTISDIDCKDQCYGYEVPFGDTVIKLNFSIKYFRGLLEHCRKNNLSTKKIQFTNVNGELVHGEFRCCYTKCNTYKPSVSYSDLEDVFVIPMPIGQYGFLLVDGNHRVCSQLNEDKSTINAIYFDYIAAASSLSSPFELAFYCFIEDFQKIRYNLFKTEHGKLNKILNINNISNGTLSIISKRENRNNML